MHKLFELFGLYQIPLKSLATGGIPRLALGILFVFIDDPISHRSVLNVKRLHTGATTVATLEKGDDLSYTDGADFQRVVGVYRSVQIGFGNVEFVNVEIISQPLDGVENVFQFGS